MIPASPLVFLLLLGGPWASGPAQADALAFQRLVVPGEAEPDQDPLDRVVRGMQTAQERIAGRDTGQPTRDIQKQVVRDLDELIRQAKKRPPPPSPQGAPPPDEPQEEPQDELQDPPQDEAEPDDASGSQTGSGAPGAQDREQAEDADEAAREREARRAELARREALLHEQWGHLPPAVRQQLLNVASEEFLQKYEDLVRRYFEALAEQGRERPR